MNDQPKRPRGRPKKPDALSSAERMRRMRERARVALNAPEAERDGLTLADVSDTALIDLAREPLRRGLPLALAEIMTEMMRRANARTSRPEFQVEVQTRVNQPYGGGWLPRVMLDGSDSNFGNLDAPTHR